MNRRFTGTLRRTGVVAAAVATALLASAGVASAATGEAYAYGPEVYGSANWQWTTSGWKNGNVALRDTKCDGEPVRIHFQVEKADNGKIFFTPARWNYNGCRGADEYWSGLTYDLGYNVSRVRLVACVDTDPLKCYFNGGWKDNPLV